ncbi:MAG: hypothetical protein KC646_14605 [Candidatus Cloacimonetes bacterium]|nr:hypothetical protein [Candidatus Cloacimonadota bacterium]
MKPIKLRSFKSNKLLSKDGMVIPMVLGAITVLFILIISMLQASSNTAMQTSVINHSVHTRFMARAAMEEMHVIAYEMLCDPRKPTALKKSLEIIKSVYGGGNYELDLLDKLQFSSRLESKQTKTKSSNSKKKSKKRYKVTISEARATFHDFSHILYNSLGLYKDPNPFYASPDMEGGVPSAGPSGSHQDFYGFLTYKVTVQHGPVEKTLSQTKSVKLVNMKPMGRKYVVYEMDPAQGKDLNEGEGFYIYGNEKARIKMIGPYNLEVGGINNGLTSVGGGFGGGAFSWSGSDNDASGKILSYPIKDEGAWWDAAFVPPPKQLPTCNLWVDAGRLSGSKGGAAIAVGFPCIGIGLGTDQQGMATPQSWSHKWNSAKLEPDEQNFSLTGRPGEFSGFKGLLYKPGDPMDQPMGVTEEGVWDPEPKTEIRHEGNIIGKYKIHKLVKIAYQFWVTIGVVPVPFTAHTWFGNGEEDLESYYAFQGDEEPKVNVMMAIIGDAIGAVGSYGVSGFADMAKNAVTQISGSGGLMGMVNSIFGDKTGFGGFDGKVTGPADINKYFPSGFRPINRAAVRRFPNLQTAFWKKNKFLMDGVFWIDEVKAKRDFKYMGKGYIATSDGFVSQSAEVKGVRPDKKDRDYLSFFIESSNPGGDAFKIDAPEIIASIYSRNGVNPRKDGFNLVGNMISSNIFKENLEHDMNVIYNVDKLALDEEEYSSWMVMSLSPKIDAFSQTMKRLGGDGDDGVQNIVDGI